MCSSLGGPVCHDESFVACIWVFLGVCSTVSLGMKRKDCTPCSVEGDLGQVMSLFVLWVQYVIKTVIRPTTCVLPTVCRPGPVTDYSSLAFLQVLRFVPPVRCGSFLGRRKECTPSSAQEDPGHVMSLFVLGVRDQNIRSHDNLCTAYYAAGPVTDFPLLAFGEVLGLFHHFACGWFHRRSKDCTNPGHVMSFLVFGVRDQNVRSHDLCTACAGSYCVCVCVFLPFPRSKFRFSFLSSSSGRKSLS